MSDKQSNKKDDTGIIPDINECTLEELKKYYQPTLFPFLKGLNGGKKQDWNNQNLDKIPIWVEMLGFDRFCFETYTKRDSLSKTLRRSERQDRPSITKAEKAMNQAIIANEKYYQLKPEVEHLVETMSQHIDDDHQLRKMLSDFFQLQAAANSMMAEIVQKQDYIMVNFTEHISAERRYDVSPTPENLSHKSIKSIKPGLTSTMEAGRLSVSNKKRTGKEQLPGPGTRFLTPRQRYELRKERGRRRV